MTSLHSTYVHVYSKSPEQKYYQPIPELDIREDLKGQSEPYSLTLMFINSCKIFYEEDSHDDIFPADSRYEDTELWTNHDSKARPLACVDWIETCTHKGICLPSYQDAQDGDTNYLLVRLAMNKSTTFDAISSRGATGLDAQTKIKDDISLPLSKNPTQWVEESRALFNTSLARIQYDALDIANGLGSNKEPLYVPQFPKTVQDKMCGVITFQLPKGYDNVLFGPTIGILIIPLVFWAIGFDAKTPFNEKRKANGYFDDLELMGIEWLLWKIFGSKDELAGLTAAAPPLSDNAGSQGGSAASRPHTPPRNVNYGTLPDPNRPQSPSLPGTPVSQDLGSRAAQSSTAPATAGSPRQAGAAQP